MYGELYVEGARSSSLPTSLPLILSSSPSPSLFTHSLLLSRGAQPQRRPRRLDMSSYFQLNIYVNYFFTQLDFCFAYLRGRVGGEVALVCLLFFFFLIDFVGHRRQFLFNQHRYFSSVSLIWIWILIPLSNSGSRTIPLTVLLINSL